VDTSLAVSGENKLRLIADSNPDTIFVSCDSHIQSIHNAQRGNWFTTIKGIKKLVQSGTHLAVNCTVTKQNYSNIKETRVFFENLGICEIYFHIAYIPESYRYFCELSCETLPNSEKNKLTDYLIWCSSRNNKNAHDLNYTLYQSVLFLDQHEKQILHPECKMGKEFVVINQSGQVSPCFYRTESWGTISQPGKIRRLSEKIQKRPFTCSSKKCASLFCIESFWRKT